MSCVDYRNKLYTMRLYLLALPLGAYNNSTMYGSCLWAEVEANPPGGISQDSAIQNGYYWQDSAWNATWWTHFLQDPSSVLSGSWESWGFPPSMPSSFECVTENGVCQVSSVSSCPSQLTHSDGRVGVLIRMAPCSHSC
jgi:hypothetical protein